MAEAAEPSTDALDRAAEVLGSAPIVALACHVNPDADALGSMLGLSNFLRERSAETVCSFGNEPLDVPRWAELLPGIDALVEAKDFPAAPDVFVTCDAASLDRLGALAHVAGKARDVIWIDHHISNEGLGTIPLIDPTASSTAEVVYRLLGRIGGEISSASAICLYAGLVTDTGRFQYGATRPETLRIAADLRERPFDHVSLAQALYEDGSARYLRLLSTALGRITLEEDRDLVWTYLTQADLADAGVAPSETDDLIDLVRTAREADVAAVVKQQRDGRFKVSMRSRGGHDVAAVAASFGGGGHRLAAGYTSKGGLAETVERLRAALADASSAP
ncbi:MAG TPA: bifunctional oligoribonuclease/PAP phosphatase NrnA [Actinomycetota bacterium]|nr:bifunctional oligoribonuclease/PAP phosphatase NrnA [Actinomycetota bacterium]